MQGCQRGANQGANRKCDREHQRAHKLVPAPPGVRRPKHRDTNAPTDYGYGNAAYRYEDDREHRVPASVLTFWQDFFARRRSDGKRVAKLIYSLASRGVVESTKSLTPSTISSPMGVGKSRTARLRALI